MWVRRVRAGVAQAKKCVVEGIRTDESGIEPARARLALVL